MFTAEIRQTRVDGNGIEVTRKGNHVTRRKKLSMPIMFSLCFLFIGASRSSFSACGPRIACTMSGAWMSLTCCSGDVYVTEESCDGWAPYYLCRCRMTFYRISCGDGGIPNDSDPFGFCLVSYISSYSMNCDSN